MGERMTDDRLAEIRGLLDLAHLERELLTEVMRARAEEANWRATAEEARIVARMEAQATFDATLLVSLERLRAWEAKARVAMETACHCSSCANQIRPILAETP